MMTIPTDVEIGVVPRDLDLSTILFSLRFMTLELCGEKKRRIESQLSIVFDNDRILSRDHRSFPLHVIKF